MEGAGFVLAQRAMADIEKFVAWECGAFLHIRGLDIDAAQRKTSPS